MTCDWLSATAATTACGEATEYSLFGGVDSLNVVFYSIEYFRSIPRVVIKIIIGIHIISKVLESVFETIPSPS